MRIALVNCLNLPEPDIDEQPMLDALAGAGHDAQTAAWDDDSVDWSSFDVAVIRATWNYFEDPTGYVDWIERVSIATTLLNPPATLKWNLHKEYLIELESKGVPTVPTAFVGLGDRVDLAALGDQRGWTEIVIKPTISAGSFATKSFDFDAGEIEHAQSFINHMLEERDMMIQRYMPSVDSVGEVAIITIDGQITHAIEKRPRFDNQNESVLARNTITDDERAFVEKVLVASAHQSTYARVDIIPDDDGSPMLSELEMLEPSLFLPFSSQAIAAFVKSIEKYQP